MRSKGTLRSWDEDKGFGFIEPMVEGPRVFVHITAFRDRTRLPEVGQVITYRLGSDDRGRPRAEQASRLGDRERKTRKRRKAVPVMPVAVAYVALLAVLAWLNKAPWVLPGSVVMVSLLTFVAYGLDKSSAQRGAWRTQESTLHLMAFLGGWPGAALAQKWLRHKSSKESFQAAFLATIVMNVALVGWLLLSESGQALMREVLKF